MYLFTQPLSDSSCSDVATFVDVMFFLSFSQGLTCLMLLMMPVSDFLCALHLKTHVILYLLLSKLDIVCIVILFEVSYPQSELYTLSGPTETQPWTRVKPD